MFPSATSGWLSESTSPLRVLISRATYPSQHEPNYAVNLEVADYIKEKKGNTYVLFSQLARSYVLSVV